MSTLKSETDLFLEICRGIRELYDKETFPAFEVITLLEKGLGFPEDESFLDRVRYIFDEALLGVLEITNPEEVFLSCPGGHSSLSTTPRNLLRSVLFVNQLATELRLNNKIKDADYFTAINGFITWGGFDASE